MANPVLDTGFASPTSVYETSTTQQHRVGSRAILGDRSFRYVKFISGTALAPNVVAQCGPAADNHTTQTETGPFTAGATTMSLTLGATVAHEQQYQEGYVRIETAMLGVGQIYRIRSHPYSAVSVALTVELYDPIVTTTSGTEVWSLLQNPWSNPVILVASGSAQTGIAVGVPLVNFAACATASVATSGYLQTATSTWTQPKYGWFQTWGVCSVLQDASVVLVGTNAIGGTVAGSVGVDVETVIKNPIGFPMKSLTSSGGYGGIFLRIAP